MKFLMRLPWNCEFWKWKGGNEKFGLYNDVNDNGNVQFASVVV